MQAAGITHSGHGRIDSRSGLRERRQGCRYHGGGGVAHQDQGWVHGDAHLLQHIGEALRREDGLPAIAGAIQPNHDAIADQLIVADAFERRQFLEADISGRARQKRRQRQHAD